MNRTRHIRYSGWKRIACYFGILTGLLTLTACSSGDGDGNDLIPIDELPAVVFIADRETNDVFELWLSANAGADIIKLSGTLVSGGNVTDFTISPDGTKVAYRADQDSDEVFELYVNDIDGGAPIPLNERPLAGSEVADDYAWAPDSSRIAYRAQQDRISEFDLYTVSPDGSSNKRISAPIIDAGGVTEFAWAPDISRIAYRADRDEDDVFELYTVKPDGTDTIEVSQIDSSKGNTDVFPGIAWATDSAVIAYIANENSVLREDLYNAPPDRANSSVRISKIDVNGQKVFEFEWSPDFVSSRRQAYTTDKSNPGAIQLHTAIINGTGASVSGSLITGRTVDVFAWAPNSSQLAYIADQNFAGIDELFTAFPTTINVITVSGILLPSQNVVEFAWQPNSQRIAYLANQDDANRFELYTARPNATDTDVKVSGRLVAGGNVREGIAWAPDSSLIAYLADQDTQNVIELFTSTSTGTRNDKISGDLVPGGNVENFLWEPAGDGVAYLADQDADDVFELYITLPDGSESAKISGSMVSGGEVLDGYRWVP